MKDIINSPKSNNPSFNHLSPEMKRLVDSKEIENEVEGEFIDYNNVTGLRLTDNNKLNKFNDAVLPQLRLEVQEE
jgi:hypothetical protein